MKRFWDAGIAVLAGSLLLVWPASAGTNVAAVGTLQTIDGTVSVNQSPVRKSETLPVLSLGDDLTTTDGHAEVILTPGVFLRMGKDSDARLLNDSFTDTSIGLNHGSAMLEVDELHSGNHLQVNLDGASATVLKTGLYRFDATPPSVQVIKGKAEVRDDDSHVVAKDKRQVEISPELTATKFHKPPDDDLARWSALQSRYEYEASLASAQYVYDMGWGWGFSNWYWNPWFGMWAWLPGNPYFVNPYGLWFCNPGFVYNYMPYRTYGAYAGFYRNPGWSARLANPGIHRGFASSRSVGPARSFRSPSVTRGGFAGTRPGGFGGFGGARMGSLGGHR
jgi:hypothetical protein